MVVHIFLNKVKRFSFSLLENPIKSMIDYFYLADYCQYL